MVISFAAPLYANHIAHTNPFENNLNGHTIVNGKRVPLMQQGGGLLHLGETPIGPTWDMHHYFLGADQQGRDVTSRVLYGGRSLAPGRDRVGRICAACSRRSSRCWPGSTAAGSTRCSRA